MGFHRSFVEFSIRRGGAVAAPAATAAGDSWSPFGPHQADKNFPRRKQKTLKKCKNIFFVPARIEFITIFAFWKNGRTGIKFQCSNLAINILHSSIRTQKNIVLFRNTTKNTETPATKLSAVDRQNCKRKIRPAHKPAAGKKSRTRDRQPRKTTSDTIAKFDNTNANSRHSLRKQKLNPKKNNNSI